MDAARLSDYCGVEQVGPEIVRTMPASLSLRPLGLHAPVLRFGDAQNSRDASLAGSGFRRGDAEQGCGHRLDITPVVLRNSVSFSCPAKHRRTSNNVLVCTFTTKPFLEVAGIEPTEEQMRLSTSGPFLASELGERYVHHAPLLTVTDRDLVSFLCSCVFFGSRSIASESRDLSAAHSQVAAVHGK